MGIDRIGKGPPPASPSSAPKGGALSEGSRAFEVRDKTSVQAPNAPESTAAASPLARLRAGEIDMDGYLKLKVEEATVHLHALSAVELHAVRQLLRDQLVSDPALADLVRQVSGPPSPQE